MPSGFVTKSLCHFYTDSENRSQPVAKTVDQPFAEHERDTSQPKPGRTHKSPPAPRLLYWLQHSWAKPLISLQEIVTYGPWNMRTAALALAQAELLEQAGWLIPVELPRRSRQDHRKRVWRTPMSTMSNSELQRLNQPQRRGLRQGVDLSG
jgi:hypothetical protein